MNLHEDSDALEELIAVTAQNMKLPQIYVEKDYWITKALKHLATSEFAGQVVFKGGTSLSKAYRLIDRFSEDIDLAIYANDLGDARRKKLFKGIEQEVTQGLTYLKGHERESKGSKFRKTVYEYPRQIDGEDFGQASPELLVEINSFTNPEPVDARILQTLIAEELKRKQEDELITKYGLEGFEINVLSVKRTFVEKMLGVIKDSYADDPQAVLSKRIRHLYDLVSMLKRTEIKEFIEGDEFEPLCQLCIADEKAGGFFYHECLENPLAEAPLFSEFQKWRPSLDATYQGVFSGLVYGEMPTMDDIQTDLEYMRTRLASN